MYITPDRYTSYVVRRKKILGQSVGIKYIFRLMHEQGVRKLTKTGQE